MIVEVFVFTSAISWGLLDLTRKILGKNFSAPFLALVLSVGQIPIVIGWTLFEAPIIYSPTYIVPTLIIVLMHSAASIAFIRSVTLAPLSETIPFLAFSPAVTALLGLTIQEWLSPLQWIGIGCIMVGVGKVRTSKAMKPGEDTSSESEQAIGKWLMLFVALCWGGAIFLDKVALQFATPSCHALLITLLSSIVLYGIVRFRNIELQMKSLLSSPALLLLPAFSGLAFITQLLAIQVYPVGVFESIKRAVGVFMAALFGLLFFQEELTFRKIALLTLVVFGTSLVLLF
ncbi:MAG: EamA family transporter [Bdellovibrionales bacterium]|nr:EamA family transporter [Bdellovibrionales bacterium]